MSHRDADALVWDPSHRSEPDAPGRLRSVTLRVESMGPSFLSLADVVVRDASGSALLDGPDLQYHHHCGGGPLASAEAALEARAFGLVNTAWHTQRAMELAQDMTGVRLPRLLVTVGAHARAGQRWGGGHYRLPAASYSELPEHHDVAPTGEIHLGPGRRFVPSGSGPYFHNPAHNPAIIYHEVGHHLCRHTADFRANALRPVHDQTNRKIPLDEGTSDVFAALLMGGPDIFGWHRSDRPRHSQARRDLDTPLTMADFRGGREVDPHVDGTVWSSALWRVRDALRICGLDTDSAGRGFAGILGRALLAIGPVDQGRSEIELRRRRWFSGLASAMVSAAAVDGAADVVAGAFALHGILPGLSNAALRDRCRDVVSA